MADNQAPPARESTGEALTALKLNFPDLMQIYNQAVAPTAMAQYNSDASVSPLYQQLTTDLYKQFAPQLAQTGQQIDNSNRLATANTDAQILAGPGAELAKTYSGIDKSINPEYYATRSLEAGKLGDLLGSINLNKPSADAERLVNQENIRTGNIGNNNATNTVSNALSFGDQLQKRQQTLSDAIGQATNFLQPSSNANFNPATAILNRPSSNTGVSQFGGVTQNTGSQAYTSGQGLMSNIAGFQNNAVDINANRRDVLDRLNETTSSL